jgi:hypothetical protein
MAAIQRITEGDPESLQVGSLAVFIFHLATTVVGVRRGSRVLVASEPRKRREGVAGKPDDGGLVAS